MAVAVWQAASLEVGLYVSGGFAGVAAALHLIEHAGVAAVSYPPSELDDELRTAL